MSEQNSTVNCYKGLHQRGSKVPLWENVAFVCVQSPTWRLNNTLVFAEILICQTRTMAVSFKGNKWQIWEGCSPILFFISYILSVSKTSAAETGNCWLYILIAFEPSMHYTRLRHKYLIKCSVLFFSPCYTQCQFKSYASAVLGSVWEASATPRPSTDT